MSHVDLAPAGREGWLRNNNGLHPQQDYRIEKGHLGQGGFGIVRKVRSKTTDDLCALKTTPKTELTMTTVLREVEVGILMDHPNIVRLFGVYEDDVNIYMVMEACWGGEVLAEIGKSFKEGDARHIMSQLLYAVNYMHNKGVAHRDLKLENLLLAREHVPLRENSVKVVDFGLSRRFEAGMAEMTTKVGSPYYVAPEILRGEVYGEKVDVWSMGVVLFAMLCGEPPFQGSNRGEVVAKVRAYKSETLTLPCCISRPSQDFVRRLMESNVSRRPSSQEALEEWRLTTGDAEELGEGHLTARLSHFAKASRFVRMGKYLMAQNVEDKKTQQWRQAFQRLDLNGDGELSFEELQAGISELGLLGNKEELRKTFDLLDLDGSGTLQYSEFLAAMLSSKDYSFFDDACMNAFQVFDKRRCGVVNCEDLQETMTSREGFREEVDGDGEMEFEDFLLEMQRFRTSRPS